MKRWFDIVVSSTLLVALSPLYLIIFILVYLDIGWPVFEKQRYPGMNEQWFTISRFRTMNRACNEKGELLPADQRLSVIGYYLKRFKLDHLPEFYNVLRGEMSLVGPRPGFIRSIPSKDVNLTRHSVCPGIRRRRCTTCRYQARPVRQSTAATCGFPHIRRTLRLPYGADTTAASRWKISITRYGMKCSGKTS